MGSRRTGRPRERCLDYASNDMKMLNMKKWKVLTLKGKAWSYLAQKAKTREEVRQDTIHISMQNSEHNKFSKLE